MRTTILAGAVVAGVAVLVVLRRRRCPKVSYPARVSYTRKPDPGRVAGRTVDQELWGRLITAFAEQPISKEELALLQDADEPHDIEAIDARTLDCAPTLSTHGFTLLSAPSKITTWERTPANEALGRREAEEVVKTLCGTQRVYAFDHTWREQPPFGPQTHIQIALCLCVLL